MSVVGDAVAAAVRMGRQLPPADVGRLAEALLEPHGLQTLSSVAGQRVRDACVELAAVARDNQARSAAAGALLASLEPDPTAASVTPVWTGPDTPRGSRLTSAVVVDLIGAARSAVLLVGYAVQNEPTVTRALSGAVERGVEVTLLLERHVDNPNYSGSGVPFPGLDAIRLCWPAKIRPSGASLHAKILVVDETAALVGSANVTGAALEKNLECGLLVKGGPSVNAIVRHIQALRTEGNIAPIDVS